MNMTTDPLQQLLDTVSVAMYYARRGFVDQGHRLLIEECVKSSVDDGDTRARYRLIIKSFERRWKIQHQ